MFPRKNEKNSLREAFKEDLVDLQIRFDDWLLDTEWYWVYRETRKAWWWLQHRFNPRHRYNIVKTGLKPGYYDPSERLVAAVLRTAHEYRWSEGGQMINWNDCEESKIAWKAYCEAADFYEKHPFWFAEDEDADDTLTDEALRLAVEVIKNVGPMWYP